MAPETMDNGRRAEGAYRLQRAGGSGSCSPDSDASLRNARLTQALVRRSSPPATNKELYAGPPTSVAVTSPMCAVSVRRLPNRDSGTCGALPVSISGISVSPAARPNPRIAAVSSQRREAGSTRQASVWERVKPRAAAVMRTVSFLRPHGRIHDQDHSGQDEQGEHQGCGEPAEAGAFPRSLADDGDKQEDGGEAVNHGGDRGHESDDARDGATEEAFFSAVLYGTGHADRERPAQEQGGDGQQERAHDHGQDAEFVGIRTPDPAEYLAPLCAEHDGQCEAGDEGEDGAHGSPGQPCRQQRESAAFRE